MLSELAPAIILSLAAFTFSFAGFGFPWVALPLLSLVMPLRDAIIFHYPFVLALVFYHAWRYRGHLAWRRHLPLLIGSAMGMPLGVWLLLALPEELMRKGMAVFIALSVLALSRDWGERLAGKVSSTPLGGAAIGLLSGWLQGAYAVGGPPVVLYIMARAKSPQEVKGFLGVYFTFICVVTASLYAVNGLFTAHWLKLSLYYSPSVLLGAAAGAWAFSRVSSVGFRRIVFIMLLAAAVALWFSS
ncbi:MAG: sulfite exporter TauE/SafE family protein [Deltaproteobacteria bacterium]|nr:sulfite exporter TauE/SafE family protein [Deltaproteobacteria bacterium]